MKRITEIFITSEDDDSTLSFFTKYPFAISKDDLLECSDFINSESYPLLDSETLRILSLANEIDFILHGINNNFFIRKVWMKVKEPFPVFFTVLTDGKILTYTKEEIAEIDETFKILKA